MADDTLKTGVKESLIGCLDPASRMATTWSINNEALVILTSETTLQGPSVIDLELTSLYTTTYPESSEARPHQSFLVRYPRPCGRLMRGQHLRAIFHHAGGWAVHGSRTERPNLP
jgi:hypothetical protein